MFHADQTSCKNSPVPGLSSIDLTILVPPDMSVRSSHEIESRVREEIMSAMKSAREVKIHIHGVEADELDSLKKQREQPGVSDFGRNGC